jgi:hypothetical protein
MKTFKTIAGMEVEVDSGQSADGSACVRLGGEDLSVDVALNLAASLAKTAIAAEEAVTGREYAGGPS